MSDAPSSAPASAPAGPASAGDSQLTGRFADEAKHGYQEMRPSASAPKPQRTEREFATGREAADELAKKRRRQNHTATEARPVEYQDEKGRKAPANETVDLNRAADDLKTSRISDASGKELGDRHQLALDVDALRAKNGVPTQIDDANIDPNQIDPRVFGDPQSHLQPQPQIDPQHLPPHLQPAPGVDPEVSRAMQHPQVREAVQQEFNKAFDLQAKHEQQIQTANDFAVAAFRSAVPEFNGLRADQFVARLQQLQRTNPARYQQVSQMLDNVGKTGMARQQVEQQRAHAERQEFQRYSGEQDRTFDRMVANHTPQQRQAIATEMVSYAQEMGVDQKTLVHLMQTNPIMRHSAFQKMMHDATVGRLAQKQLAQMRQQQRAANLPPVARPGHSNGGGVRQVQSANLQALSSKLSQSGDARDAAALLIAQRNARRRG
jgi:hypothetical protein